MGDRVSARYEIETAFKLSEAVEAMAGEQSTGTFARVPGETDELREAHAARVERITQTGEGRRPALPGAKVPPAAATRPVYRRAEVELSWPLANMGPSLPNLLATVAGNLFELAQFSALRLLDIQLPPAFASAYAGPQFGVDGTRRLAGVAFGPLIGTIIKPSVGLSPEATAEAVSRLAEGGIDFIKDDELQADGPHNPLELRVEKVMRVLNDHAERTGKKIMYAFNITGGIDQMLQRHDQVRRAGGTCIMVSLNGIGLAGLDHLRRYSQLPIHGHRNGWGLFSRSPDIGMSYRAYQKLWRLAGADHMHVNGLRNKFCEDDDSVVESARTCLTPMFTPPDKDCIVMPVFSSGQTARQVPDTYKALGSTDLIYCCGGGVVAHPGGVAAGVASLRQAWEAALEGRALDEAARDNAELAQALDAFR